MDEGIEPLYSTLESEGDIMATAEKKPSSEVKLQMNSGNEKTSKFSEVECETEFHHDGMHSEIPEYAVVNKSKKSKVVHSEIPEYAVVNKSKKSKVAAANSQSEENLRSSTHFYKSSERTTVSPQKTSLEKIPMNQVTVDTSIKKTAKYKYYGVAFTAGIAVALLIVSLILNVLVYLEMLVLRGRQETTIISNTSTFETSLKICLEQVSYLSHTVNTAPNISTLESAIQNYLEELTISNTCKLECSHDNEMPTRCAHILAVNISDGNWMKVVDLDMTNTTSCPLPNFTVSNVSGFNTCRSLNSHPGCYSTLFNASGNMTYSKVYGRIKAYQYNKTNSFYQFRRANNTIDDPYVDGISLTYGLPRQHIWTFASDVNQSRSFCPCSTSQDVAIPDFVGEDYFCDSGIRGNQNYSAAFSNPLWDGEGCHSNYNCCTHNCPPWFYKELDYCTSDPIELRVCRDQYSSNEDILIQAIEIYIHH